MIRCDKAESSRGPLSLDVTGAWTEFRWFARQFSNEWEVHASAEENVVHSTYRGAGDAHGP